MLGISIYKMGLNANLYILSVHLELKKSNQNQGSDQFRKSSIDSPLLSLSSSACYVLE